MIISNGHFNDSHSYQMLRKISKFILLQTYKVISSLCPGKEIKPIQFAHKPYRLVNYH